MAAITISITLASLAKLIGAAAVLKAGHEIGGEVAKGISGATPSLKNNYQKFHNNLENSPLNKLDPYTILGKMKMENYIDADYYERAIKLLEKAEDVYDGDGKFNSFDDVADFFGRLSISNKDAKNLAELYGKMADYSEDISNYTSDLLGVTSDDIKQGFKDAVPNIPDTPAPSYFDTDIDPYQIDVEPAKIWTNQELADHHNIDYDLNNYYDLIKQGTEANVALGEYQSAQMANAALQDNTASNVSYLDSIRQSKANAMAEGATLGARAAQDLLANMNNLNTFAENQATVAQNRYNAVDAYLQADAQAKIQANNYFTKLASSLWNDSASLYYSDTDVSSQGYKTNATLHGADRNLAGKNAYLNGTMAGNYADAQAYVNAARASAQAVADEYAWVFDRFLGANNGDVVLASRDFDNYIFNRYTGYKSPYDYLLDNANEDDAKNRIRYEN